MPRPRINTEMRPSMPARKLCGHRVRTNSQT
jgi:hypothetical protein